jgi:hypothetical protein
LQDALEADHVGDQQIALVGLGKVPAGEDFDAGAGPGALLVDGRRAAVVEGYSSDPGLLSGSAMIVDLANGTTTDPWPGLQTVGLVEWIDDDSLWYARCGGVACSDCSSTWLAGCRPVRNGYRVRRTIEGISPSRLDLIGQWKARDHVGLVCLAQQAPCDIQNFVFTGAGVFFRGFLNNRLPDGSYVLDYPRGNPVDADTTARLFVDLAPLVGFRHEYAVTSIDTTTAVNADFAESPIDSSQLVYLTPSTPPATNLEHVAVVPNPYKGSAEWDLGPNQRAVHFINVPSGSTIRIFTSAGDLLRVLTQDPNSSAGGSTGELAWDLKNDSGNMVVSGIYLYTVQPPDGRTPKKGHFVIIK